MKKWIALWLALVMIVALCACGTAETPASSAGIGQQAGKEKTPAAAQSGAQGQAAAIPEPTLKEMTVTLSFGPQIELVLTEHFQCVAGKGLNEAGEALLEGIDLEDRTHYMLFKEILRKAQEQGLLQQDTRLEIAAQSQDPSIWHAFSQQILALPAERFMEETGAAFRQTVKLPKAAPDQFVPEAHEPYTDRGEGYTCEGNMDNETGMATLLWTFQDYEMITYTLREQELDSIRLEFYADGFSFDRSERNRWAADAADQSHPGFLESVYGESTEGRYYAYLTRTKPEGTLIAERFWATDGTAYETFYDDAGKLQSITGRDGAGVMHPEATIYEEIYGENGNCVSITRWTEDGTVVGRIEFYPDGMQKESFSLGAGGKSVETSYYENGNLKFERIVYTGNSVEDTASYYENGNPEYTKRVSADGTYEETAYYENGQVELYRKDFPGGYSTLYEYNEDGTWKHRKDFNIAGSMEMFYENGRLVKVIQDGVEFVDEKSLEDYRQMGY